MHQYLGFSMQASIASSFPGWLLRASTVFATAMSFVLYPQPQIPPPQVLRHHIHNSQPEDKHQLFWKMRTCMVRQETQIIYPAGTNAILWQADQKQQKIFQGVLARYVTLPAATLIEKYSGRHLGSQVVYLGANFIRQSSSW